MARAEAWRVRNWFHRVRLAITEIPFVIISVLVAESLTCGNIHAQRAQLQFQTHKADSIGLAVVEYDPPPQYEGWWREIATCEELPLPDKHWGVQYFALNVREYFVTDKKVWAIGSAMADKGQMFFAFPYMLDKTIFMHEAAHFLIAWAKEKTDPDDPNGDVDHPFSRYGDKVTGKCGIFPYRRDSVDYR